MPGMSNSFRDVLSSRFLCFIAEAVKVLLMKLLMTVRCLHRQVPHLCGDLALLQTFGPLYVDSLSRLIQISIGRYASMVLSPSHAKLSACDGTCGRRKRDEERGNKVTQQVRRIEALTAELPSQCERNVSEVCDQPRGLRGEFAEYTETHSMWVGGSHHQRTKMVDQWATSVSPQAGARSRPGEEQPCPRGQKDFAPTGGLR